MCYSISGYKYPGGFQEGNGYKSGDVVEVNVDRSSNTVKYISNGVLKAKHSN